MANRPYFKTTKYSEQQTRANWRGVHPDIRLIAEGVLGDMANLGVPMFVHSAMRTVADQQAAYALGHSNHDGSKPYAHMGFAVDIIHCEHGWNMPKLSWLALAHVVAERSTKHKIPIEHGYFWKKPWDPAHVELKGWRLLELPDL